MRSNAKRAVGFSPTARFKAIPPRFPQYRTTVLNGLTVRTEIYHGRGASHNVEARADGHNTYPYTGFASVAVWPRETKLVDLWIEPSFRGNGLGQYMVSVVGEIWPDVVWVDTEQSRPFYDRLIERGLIERVKAGRHFFSQSKYAMARNNQQRYGRAYNDEETANSELSKK
jgi:hypothetical protein